MANFRTAAATLAAILMFGAGNSIAQDEILDPGPPDQPELDTELDIDVVAPGPGEPLSDLFDKDTFATRTIVCPFKGAIEYEAGEISCALLEVPENREKARPRKIELHYVKISAKEPDDWDAEEDGEWKKADDPVVYLTGGPGARVAGYVERFKSHGLIEKRDLYILEQRGIGSSLDFCPLYSNIDPAPANTDNWDAYQRAGRDAIEQCFKSAKANRVDLSGYNSIENARDVEALRRALGFDQWNVWGISYGSILGQAYIKQDPEGIRAVVLDAIVPLQQDVVFHNIARYFDRTMTILEEACLEDETCAANHGDFKEKLKKAIAKTSDAPIVVDALDTELFPSGKGYFFQDIVGGAPFTQFYEQDNYAALPAFIDAFADSILNDDTEKFRMLTAGGGGSPFSISQGMYNAIMCNDGWPAGMKKAFTEDYKDYPVLAMVFGDPAAIDEVAQICRDYGMKPRPAEEYSAVQTDIPAIIAEGQMDPITPPPLAEIIMPGFENGTYVEFPFAGHGPTRSVECAGDFLNAFFDDPTADVDTTCADEMAAPDFIGPLFQTDAIPSLIATAAEDEKQLGAPMLMAGVPAFVFLIGAFVYTLAPVARLINGTPGHPTAGARPLAWLISLLGAASVGGLGYAGYAAYEASDFLLFTGLMGYGRWFAAAGVLAGALSVLLLWRTVVARAREALPIGVLLGLFATAISGAAFAVFLMRYGFSPF